MPVEYYPDGEIFEEEYEDEEMNDLVKSLYSSKSRDSVSDMVSVHSLNLGYFSFI